MPDSKKTRNNAWWKELAGAAAWCLMVASVAPLGLGIASPVIALLAWVSMQPPRYSSPFGRHGDVGRFQRTAFGRRLLFRGWLPSEWRSWMHAVLWPALALPAAAVAFGLWDGTWPGARNALAGLIFIPVALLAAAMLVDTLLFIPIVTIPISLFMLVYAGVSFAAHDYPKALLLFGAFPCAIAALFVQDVARLMYGRFIAHQSARA